MKFDDGVYFIILSVVYLIVVVPVLGAIWAGMNSHRESQKRMLRRKK